MMFDKVLSKKNFELLFFILIYCALFSNVIFKDNPIAIISAFCGITYTILAGKGIPSCYLIGVTGSFLYSYLAYKSAFWGNLVLYACYYVPMQIFGFFQWNKNLKDTKNEIIKTSLDWKNRLFLIILGSIVSVIMVFVLMHFGDNNPVIDSITTVFSIIGLYLTVRRCIEQWLVWIVVNGLSLIMWLKVAMSGVKVYSTVLMWTVYFILAFYFYFTWRKELKTEKVC